MVKTMLKLSKMAYVIGLLSICKIWVKSRALNPDLTYPSTSWELGLTKS